AAQERAGAGPGRARPVLRPAPPADAGPPDLRRPWQNRRRVQAPPCKVGNHPAHRRLLQFRLLVRRVPRRDIDAGLIVSARVLRTKAPRLHPVDTPLGFPSRSFSRFRLVLLPLSPANRTPPRPATAPHFPPNKKTQ